ncbi:MAG: hypothetical protein ACRC20_08330 [Segniliparus sp.]|uniref:hypothetical protein n=1 Tax=Segniliparus sp. TaxID=2804064 RepID=UPI003F3FFACA
MRRSARTGSVLALIALLAASCGEGRSQAPTGTDSLNWRATDVCAGIKAQDLAELGTEPLVQQRQDDPDRAGCVFVDRSGFDRFSAVLVYLGYDPRDLALLSPQQGPPPAGAWQRQISLDERPALVVAESADNCQVILPLSGEQDGWGVRFELGPAKPAAAPGACGAHLALLQKAAHGLPDLLRAPFEAPAAPPSADPGSTELVESCAQFRSAQSRASAMALPLLDAAGQPLSVEAAKAMSLTSATAAEGLIDSANVARRLAVRPLPAQLRTELKLYVKNADRFREKLQGPLQTGDVYLRLALAMQVNAAKAIAFCPAE